MSWREPDIKTLPTRGKPEARYWFIFLIILSAGTIFRVYFIDYRSFWIDEVFSVYFASASVRNLFNLLKADNQSPLFFFLLHYWIKLLSDSDIAVRLFSVAWGSIGILGTYYLLGNGLRWSPKSTLVGVCLVVINPLHVYYSIEARCYSMLFALSVFYLASLCRIYSTGGKRYYIAFVSLQVLLIYTHPTALIYCFTVNLIYLLLLLSMKQLNKLRFRNLLIANAITLLLFLPWIRVYWLQVQATSEHFWAPPLTAVDTIKIWGRLVLFLSTDLIDLHPERFKLSTPNVLMWSAAALPVVMLMLAGIFYSFKRKGITELLVVISFFLYPTILCVISLLIKPIMITRVLIPVSIGFIALILTSVEQHVTTYKRAILHMLLALFVFICSALNFFIIKVGGAADWRKAAAEVSKISTRDDLILIFENPNTLLFNRYNKSDISVRGITGDYEERWYLKQIYGSEWSKYFTSDYNLSIDSNKTVERLDRLVDSRQRVILVFAPINNNKVLSVERSLLKRWEDYKPNKIATLDHIRILSLARMSEHQNSSSSLHAQD
jgi:mannosyltransferase